MTTEAYVYDAIRTPRGRGKANGSLHGTKPIDLVVGLIHEIRARFPDLDPAAVDDIVLGVVSPIGDQGSDIARIAAIAAGLPDTVAGVQENRFCASGLEAVNLAAAKVRSGWEDLVLAGGVESMSRVSMGSDGGAWAMDPMTSFETGFAPRASAPTSSPPSRGSAAATWTSTPPSPRSAPPPPGRRAGSPARSCPSATATA